VRGAWTTRVPTIPEYCWVLGLSCACPGTPHQNWYVPAGFAVKVAVPSAPAERLTLTPNWGSSNVWGIAQSLLNRTRVTVSPELTVRESGFHRTFLASMTKVSSARLRLERGAHPGQAGTDDHDLAIHRQRDTRFVV
jgi:hypothetical protein